MEDFKLDLKMAKQNALHNWTLELIEQVLQDKDKKRTRKQKYEIIKQVVFDAIDLEENF